MINKFNFLYTLTLIAFWAYVTVGFVSEEILPFMGGVRTPVNMLCDIIVAIIGIGLLKSRSDRWILLSFLAIGFLSWLINRESIFTTLNGMRDFIGIILSIPILRYFLSSSRGAEFREKFDRQLFIYLVIQAVCITEQFLRYGANDHGGGSWGNNHSGIVSTSIYIISFYLMTRRWDSTHSYIDNLVHNWILIFLLYPTFLNETKVSFVYFLCYFVLLLELNRRFLSKLVLLSPAILVASAGVGWLYMATLENDVDEEVFSWEIMEEYIFGGENADEYIEIALMAQDDPTMEIDNEWVVDLPRFTKLFLLSEVLEPTKGGLWFGAGLGQFKGGSTGGQTEFARENEWYMRGTRPLSMFIILQIGMIGLLWFIIAMITDIDFKRNLYGQFGANIKWYFAIVVLGMLFYNEAMRAMPLCIIMFYPLVQTLVSIPGDRNSDTSGTLSTSTAQTYG